MSNDMKTSVCNSRKAWTVLGWFLDDFLILDQCFKRAGGQYVAGAGHY